jgi:hypothetical protein
MHAPNMSKLAGGTIRPARFVKYGTSEGTVLEADAAEQIFGVSQKEQRRLATFLSDGNAAISGEIVGVHGPGEVCYLEIAGTITLGTRLKSDADGKGVGSVADDEEYGAVAEQSGVSGDLILVRVQPGTLSGSADD